MRPGTCWAVHTVAGGDRTFRLPRRAEEVYDVFERRTVAHDTNEFQVKLQPESTALFYTGATALLPEPPRADGSYIVSPTDAQPGRRRGAEPCFSLRARQGAGRKGDKSVDITIFDIDFGDPFIGM